MQEKTIRLLRSCWSVSIVRDAGAPTLAEQKTSAKAAKFESAAPDSDREVTHSMVLHESAINKFAQLELAGDAENSLNDVIAQLQYPLIKPA